MQLNRAGGVQLAFGFNVGLLCKFLRLKRANKNTLTIRNDCGSPFVVPLVHTENPGNAVPFSSPLVLSVTDPRNITQVFKSVVGRVPVNVVNFLVGPDTCHVEPRKPVSQIYRATNGNLKSSIRPAVSNGFTNRTCFPNNNLPGKYPSDWIVIDKLPEALGGQGWVHNFWHRKSGVMEVGNSVVAENVVFPAKVFLRKLSMYMQPSKSGSGVLNVVNKDSGSSSLVVTSGYVTGQESSAPDAESKNPGVWVVVKQFAQTLCGKICSSHAVSPRKKWFGQKPRRVTSTSGLRYFSFRGPIQQSLLV